MTYRDKTQSFTYTKQPQPQKPLHKVYSPQRSSSNLLSIKSIQPHFTSSRFLRKDLLTNQPFDPRVYITHQLSYQDVVDLKQVFDTYDSTGLGVLLPNDLKLFLEQNGFSPNKTTVYDILAEFDEGETGGIGFKDFMRAMGKKPKEESRKEIMAVWKKLDGEGRGWIDGKSVREAGRRVKEEIGEKESEEMMRKREGEGSGGNKGKGNEGRMEFEEFYQVMVKGYSWY